ncbi:MAG: type I methionyl aminopeptidase [Candidatus Moranbacteria bacterium]|jgi:methionyl aminopeptidase|nr:type I methionyl aminopeptidase [Candidatus Moranbacteria bacterium]
MKEYREKSVKELGALRESGKRLHAVLKTVMSAVRPGVSTQDLDTIAEQEIRAAGGMPIFKGYGSEWGKPFPASLCTSLNQEVVHGIPSEKRILREGDLVKLDIGLRFEGMVTDMARTVAVGPVSAEADRLLRITRESLDLGITNIRAGAHLSDYARAVQRHAEQNGYAVVRDLVGHGVGHELHEDPQVPNYFHAGIRDFVFTKGMVLALEPMINAGGLQVRIAPDGWTFVTNDGKLSAHFEDTIIVTESGTEIVTRG